MKNPEFHQLYEQELKERGAPTLKALEILARSAPPGGSKKNQSLRTQADMLFKKRMHVEREAQAAVQHKLAHKEAT